MFTTLGTVSGFTTDPLSTWNNQLLASYKGGDHAAFWVHAMVYVD
jgi:hypothetical protein